MIDKKMKAGHGKIFTVDKYIEIELYDNKGGAVECSARNAEKAQEAVGRLCQVLANKGILSANDIFYIARGWESSDEEYSS